MMTSIISYRYRKKRKKHIFFLVIRTLRLCSLFIDFLLHGTAELTVVTLLYIPSSGLIKRKTKRLYLFDHFHPIPPSSTPKRAF